MAVFFRQRLDYFGHGLRRCRIRGAGYSYDVVATGNELDPGYGCGANDFVGLFRSRNEVANARLTS